MVGLRAALVIAVGTLLPVAASAHFYLVEPASTLVQSERGDPQKIAPCGGTTKEPGVQSNAETNVKGGSSLHIKVKETIYHPGHYRIALAESVYGLPKDPETTTKPTDKGPWSVSAKIDPNPKAPVLADGLFVHTERVPSGQIWETDVKIPNVNCKRCLIQVVQWMGEHGFNPDGDYSYHHCAALNITADPSKPIDKDWLKTSK